MNNPVQLTATPLSEALKRKIDRLRACPLDEITFNDMLYLTPEDERRYGTGGPQERDPLEWGELSPVERQSAPSLSGNNAARSFKWILQIHLLLVIGAVAVTAAVWKLSPWGITIAWGVWLLALVASWWTTQVGIKRFTVAVKEPLTRAQNEPYPWRVVRQLAITFQNVRESPVLLRGFKRSLVLIDRFDSLFSKNRAPTPNSFDYMLEELRLATIFALQQFQAQTPKKGPSDGITAEKRFDQILTSPLSKMDQLQGRWFWAINICHNVMIAVVGLGVLPVIAVLLKPN